MGLVSDKNNEKVQKNKEMKRKEKLERRNPNQCDDGELNKNKSHYPYGDKSRAGEGINCFKEELSYKSKQETKRVEMSVSGVLGALSRCS